MKLLSQTVTFDADLLQKYNKAIPRYTSYPPATELSANFEEKDFLSAVAVANYKKNPLSLYCHIPFCDSACYFCGCNTIITQQKKVADPYLAHLIKNIDQVSQLISKDRNVNQLHWGGGTPNYLNQYQIEILWNAINERFTFDKNAEISIEVNPRSLDRNYIFFLKNIGFNRISFGIQDFNSKVQEAVNRIQPEKMLFETMGWIKEAGFESINVDLIYGLPHQNLETFTDTINKTIKLDPDRIAVFNFAYIPTIIPTQKHINETDLPSTAEKLAMFQMTIETLTNNGYVYIGMDHFAKPNDELTIAQQEGTLHRNFQGYTTKPESDLLSFGITSISMLNDVYLQNHKKLKPFYEAVEGGKLPIEKGVKLSQDDIIRRTIIMELMCQFQLNTLNLESKYSLGFDGDFQKYFEAQIPQLKILEEDGLIHIFDHGLKVTPRGKLLIRNIASVFDGYLAKNQNRSFSKSI
jgi:oxygen-independent coproporphyrinogen III oxidase